MDETPSDTLEVLAQLDKNTTSFHDLVKSLKSSNQSSNSLDKDTVITHLNDTDKALTKFRAIILNNLQYWKKKAAELKSENEALRIKSASLKKRNSELEEDKFDLEQKVHQLEERAGKLENLIQENKKLETEVQKLQFGKKNKSICSLM